MGLATAANAPAATPPPSAHAGAHGIVSTAEAAPRGNGTQVKSAGFVLDRSRASLSSEGQGASLASSGPDPLVAWMLAAGFLGIIVMRRTRASQAY